MLPNGLELSYPAEAGTPSVLYGTPTGQTSTNHGPARRVSFSELLGAIAFDSNEKASVLSDCDCASRADSIC